MRCLPLVVVVVLFVACSGAAQTPPMTEPSATTAATTSTLPDSTTTTAEPRTSTTVDPYAFDIVIEGSTVTGGGRISVPLGETVTLRFTSEVADEIHIHGYELSLDLEPGVTAEISFLAEIPGIVEIETHSNHQVVANLESS